MDTPFAYDSMTDLEPQSPYGVSTMSLPGPPSSSPHLDFNSLNLANSIGEYSYSSSAPYTTASPGRPYTPPDNDISPPAVYLLSGGELSSDDLTSGMRSRESGTHSPSSIHSVDHSAAACVPRAHRFNPIMAPTTRSATKAARRKSQDDFQPSIHDNASINMRRETTRRRLESKQRRRDELCRSLSRGSMAVTIARAGSSAPSSDVEE